MSEHLVIVGGGQAAAQAVQSLRQQGFAGAITLLGDEPYPPYQRPPLSKKYFAGELARERLLLRPAAFYAEKNVALEQNARVEEIEPAARRVRLRDGRTLAYDRLLLATGSRARELAVPGADLPGVHYLRTIADVDAISASLAPGARVLLVGAGYIGLEVAAVAR
jgi:3-phenylpropionate/trans-cinnamate dioxygenase ferredoxin reductase component